MRITSAGCTVCAAMRARSPSFSRSTWRGGVGGGQWGVSRRCQDGAATGGRVRHSGLYGQCSSSGSLPGRHPLLPGASPPPAPPAAPPRRPAAQPACAAGWPCAPAEGARGQSVVGGGSCKEGFRRISTPPCNSPTDACRCLRLLSTPQPPHLQVVQQLQELVAVGLRILARRARRRQRRRRPPQRLDLAAQRVVGLRGGWGGWMWGRG